MISVLRGYLRIYETPSITVQNRMGGAENSGFQGRAESRRKLAFELAMCINSIEHVNRAGIESVCGRTSNCGGVNII